MERKPYLKTCAFARMQLDSNHLCFSFARDTSRPSPGGQHDEEVAALCVSEL